MICLIWYDMIYSGSREGEDVVVIYSLASCSITISMCVLPGTKCWQGPFSMQSQEIQVAISVAVWASSLKPPSTLQSTAGLAKGCRTPILEKGPLKSLLTGQCSEEPCLIRGGCWSPYHFLLGFEYNRGVDFSAYKSPPLTMGIWCAVALPCTEPSEGHVTFLLSMQGIGSQTPPVKGEMPSRSLLGCSSVNRNLRQWGKHLLCGTEAVFGSR